MTSNEVAPSARIAPVDNRELEPIEGAPLPLSEAKENPPLVVDLPEGQKLVVGNLDPGVVIEVATWRGTGRPDSRTSRLMLGVSTNDDEDIPKSRALPPRSRETQEETEIIRPQIGGHAPNDQVRTGVIYTNLNPVQPAREIVMPESHIKGRKTLITKLIITLGTFLTLSLISALLFGIMDLRFAHPQSGIKTSTGSADTAIVLIKPSENLEVGKNVIADIYSSKKNPVLTVVAGKNNEAILLASDGKYHQIRSNNVRGEVVLVFPYFGRLARVFGL